jgi:hypothetical protein
MLLRSNNGVTNAPVLRYTYIACRIKVFHSPTDAQGFVFKTILKFTLKLTLKQLLHVSVRSASSGSALFELAKVTVVKITN